MTVLITLAALALPQAQQPQLRIDPLLLHQAAEVFEIIASQDNPVWPGWDASETPILLYIPGTQDLLLNHPSPPEGFVPFETDLLPPGWSAHLKDEQTICELDGQNTSRTIGGVRTLIVADTVSNMRPNLVQLLRDPADIEERIERLTVDMLTMDPYEQLAFIVHEAFHVHQDHEAPNKYANERFILEYPWLSAEVNVGWVLEGRALLDALRAEDEGSLRRAAVRWLAVRDARRAALGPDSIAYEDGNEFGEGLAKYTEWKLCQVLEGRKPGRAMRWARGFRGYQDLSFWRERILATVARSTSGEMVVNGDPHGSGNLRFRLYFTGMAIAALLDALEVPDWQVRILQPGTTLTGLAREAIEPSEQELRAGLERAHADPDLPGIEAAKAELEQAGLAAAMAMLDKVQGGQALFTLDYSALGELPVAFSFTPFGLTRVDEQRMLYTMVPVGATVAGAELRQQVPTPLLHDKQAGTIQFQLREALDRRAFLDSLELDELSTDPLESLNVTLPGATLRTQRARVSFEAGGVRVELLPR